MEISKVITLLTESLQQYGHVEVAKLQDLARKIEEFKHWMQKKIDGIRATELYKDVPTKAKKMMEKLEVRGRLTMCVAVYSIHSISSVGSPLCKRRRVIRFSTKTPCNCLHFLP